VRLCSLVRELHGRAGVPSATETLRQTCLSPQMQRVVQAQASRQLPGGDDWDAGTTASDDGGGWTATESLHRSNRQTGSAQTLVATASLASAVAIRRQQREVLICPSCSQEGNERGQEGRRVRRATRRQVQARVRRLIRSAQAVGDAEEGCRSVKARVVLVK
jgi:hypothetical protein